MRFLTCLTMALSLVSMSALPASSQTELLSPEIVRRDIASLYDGLEQAHFDLFAHRDRPAYAAYRDTLIAEVDEPLSKLDAAILFQRLAAYGRIGHARVDAPIQMFVQELMAGGALVPLFVRVDSEHVLLTATADMEGRFRAGDELLALNGRPAAEWLERLSSYVSADTPDMGHAQMEESFPILLAFELGQVDAVEVTIRKSDGRLVEGVVPAVTLATRDEINAAFPTPAFDTDFGSRAFEILPDGIGYLRPGPFVEIDSVTKTDAPNYDTTNFSTFIDDAFRRLIAAGTEDLIIDLRNNPGGDNSFSDPMVAWFADRPFRFASRFLLRASPQTKAAYRRQSEEMDRDSVLAALSAAEAEQTDGARYPYPLPWNAPRLEPRFHGRIHVLINRHSYSNAASVAAMIQDYDFGELVGEATTDMATTYASVQTFDLPATGITVTYPKSRIIRPNGDETLAGVRPDHSVPREPIGTAVDVVLQQAVGHVLASRPSPS